MLEKPALADEKIIRCLEADFGLSVETIAFLPLGADQNTAVYRADTRPGEAYFVKLRSGEFVEASVRVPRYLSVLGIRQIIPPLMTRSGQPWASLPPYKVILYPYIAGRDGFERNLTNTQWVEFGAALKQFHSADIPAAFTRDVPREEFSSRWRDAVRLFLQRIDEAAFPDRVAAEMAAFLKTKSMETLDLVNRADRLAQALQENPPAFILCHADIHAWNLLVADDGAFYMVDWDTLIFAPKERDLMFVGSGLGGNGHTPEDEEALFYQGYGPVVLDHAAITYYRYERIIEDIAVFCEQIFETAEGGEDRAQAFEYLRSNYLPGGVIELAYQAEKRLSGV